ncbi:MAG: hypothetical protein JW882_00245 [Deltaproteobacteria bacterium]|nr:hypothetical protein [Deltaproteobacteria bacterium]
MTPYEQGALDGLCAIYSIVNAARIISDIQNSKAKMLFSRILEYLEQSRDLSRVLSEGIGLTTIGSIFRDVVGDLIPYRKMPYKNLPSTPLDEFWSEMIAFLDAGKKRAILICLGGPMWDHWSIVHEITARQIRFFDSHKLRRLNRTRCTTIRSTSRRPHVLCPTHTYFLSLEP